MVNFTVLIVILALIACFDTYETLDSISNKPIKISEKFKNDSSNNDYMINLQQSVIYSNGSYPLMGEYGFNSSLYPLKPKPNLYWFNDSKCSRPVDNCAAIPIKFCYGAPVFYESAFSLWTATDFDRSLEILDYYKNVINFGECGQSLRLALCAVLIAPCMDNRVLLVEKSVCIDVSQKCKFLRAENLLPQFFSYCQNLSIFTSTSTSCQASDKKPRLQWNISTAACFYPLVPTTDLDSWILPNIPCGINCSSPYLTDIERVKIVEFAIPWFTVTFLICGFTYVWMCLSPLAYSRRLNALHNALLCCVIIVLIFIVSNVFPTSHIFYCKDDGTLRTKEPRLHYRKNQLAAWCILQYFMLNCAAYAAAIWLLVYAYVENCAFQFGDILAGQRYQGRRCYYHLFSWGPAIFINIFPLFLQKIDADGIFYVCSVGYQEPLYQLGFVYIPLLFILMLSVIFVFVGFYRSCQLVDENRKPFVDTVKMGQMPRICKLCLLFIPIILCVIASVIVYFLDVFSPSERILTDWKEFIICRLFSNGECHLKLMRSVFLVQLVILSICFAPLILVIYLWTENISASGISWCTKLGSMRLFQLCFRCNKSNSHHPENHTNGKISNGYLNPELGVAFRNHVSDDISVRVLHGNTSRQKLIMSSEDNAGESDPEFAKRKTSGNKNKFFRRSKINHQSFNRRLLPPPKVNSDSEQSLKSSVVSTGTPLSLQSGTLNGSFAQNLSEPDIGFPDLNRYPVCNQEMLQAIYAAQASAINAVAMASMYQQAYLAAIYLSQMNSSNVPQSLQTQSEQNNSNSECAGNDLIDSSVNTNYVATSTDSMMRYFYSLLPCPFSGVSASAGVDASLWHNSGKSESFNTAHSTKTETGSSALPLLDNSHNDATLKQYDESLGDCSTEILNAKKLEANQILSHVAMKEDTKDRPVVIEQSSEYDEYSDSSCDSEEAEHWEKKLKEIENKKVFHDVQCNKALDSCNNAFLSDSKNDSISDNDSTSDLAAIIHSSTLNHISLPSSTDVNNI